MSSEKIEQVIREHEDNGKYFSVNGIRTFVLDEGTGDVVFCIHGVPTSSFLYRKVVRELQQSGMRAIAIDLPGLGLSERPKLLIIAFPLSLRFAKMCYINCRLCNFTSLHMI